MKKGNAGAEFSIAPFWFWNDDINDAQSAEQLDMMKRVGANQPIIHARTGLVTEYLSEDWFARIGAAIETARANGQKIWLYDEKNWPSGNCAQTLTLEEKYREHFLQFDGDGTPRVETDPYEPVGKFCVDYLSRGAIAAFIKSTHEKYRERFGADFGGVVIGTFMDETRFCNAYPWTESFPDEFKKRKGYDIMPLLPQLYREGEQTAMVRCDYYDVVSDLYAEATFGQIYDWCEKNKLKTTGHILGEETLAAQCYFGGDVLRVMKYLHIPGIDHLGNGTGSLDAKFVSSAAHHYGRDRAACEAFGGAGWDMDYEDMVHISNWLFQQGINLIIMHGFYYSIRGERARDWPPSYFYQWKHWDRMKEYVPMANRMMETLSGGRVEADVLVYSPMESFQASFEPDLSLKTFFPRKGTVDADMPFMASLPSPPPIKNETAARIDSEFQILCATLEDENIGYEIIGADAIAYAVDGNKVFHAEGGRIVNTLTGAAYSVFVLPCAKILTEAMVKLLDAFTAQGGTVISYRSDADLTLAKDGSHMRATLQAVNKAAFKNAAKIGDAVALCRGGIDQKWEIVEGAGKAAHSQAHYPPCIIDPYIHNGERVYGVAVSRYVKDGARMFHITNYNMDDEAIRIRFESEGAPALFDPETGETKVLECPVMNGWHECGLTLRANRSVFVMCPPKK